MPSRFLREIPEDLLETPSKQSNDYPKTSTKQPKRGFSKRTTSLKQVSASD